MKRLLASVSSSFLLNIVTAVFLLATGLITIFIVNQSMRRQALVEAEAKAKIFLDRNMAIHMFFTQDLKPSLLAWTKPIRPDDYFDPAWMSSTYAIRKIENYFHEINQTDYEINDAAINARSPQNEAKKYEKKFLDDLKENLGKIFEPLFSNKAGGIGLGLALVKILTEGQGGTVEVQSDGIPSHGTSFIIHLPAS